MLKGFRDFIMRGNVVDLAIGFVVGAAFTGLVTDLTHDFVNPLINLFGGGTSVSGTFKVHGQTFNWGEFVSGVINFLLVAAVVYFLIVLPLNKLNERRLRLFKPSGSDHGEAVHDEAAVSPEVALLTQIRDALVAGRAPGSEMAPAQRAASTGDDGTAPETA